MKKREINPIGPLVLEFLKEHASALYSYLLKKKRMRSWSLKTSRLILISISMLDLFFIGMIVLIIGWWIMTLFAYWKGMLVIHPGLRCHHTKGHVVTRTTTKKWLLLNGILIRKDIDMSWRGIPLWNTPLILTTRPYDISKLTLLETHQADHQANITKYSIVEYFVIFLVLSVCCDSSPIVAWNMLWLEMGVDDLFWYIVGAQNILNKILF